MDIEIRKNNSNIDEILQEIKRVFPGFEKNHTPQTVEIIVSIVKNHLRNDGAEGDDRYIIIKQKSIYKKIFLRDIYFAETFERKITIYTKDEIIDYYGKMNELEETLGDGFFRTHRAYIVNMEHVEAFDVDSVKLPGGAAIMSKAKYPEFVKSMKSLSENNK